MILPEIIEKHSSIDEVTLKLKLQRELPYQPLLPAVTQIAFVINFISVWTDQKLSLLSSKYLKFTSPLFPESIVLLTIKHVVSFNYTFTYKLCLNNNELKDASKGALLLCSSSQ